MPVIAITREMGSLGKDVARGVADALGIPVIYHEIIDQLADCMRLRKSHVMRLLDGRAGFLERMTADQTSLSIFAAEEIVNAALQGNGAVIRGWGATQLLRDMDPDLPIRNVGLVANQINVVLMPQRFGATLLGVLALVALCISTVGIYSVVAYGVSQRTKELGIRMALGADRRHIVRVVATRSGLAVAMGIAVGALLAGLTSRGLEQFLYGITRLDVVTFAGAVSVLGIAAVVACLVPVRRALRVDPISVMRSE